MCKVKTLHDLTVNKSICIFGAGNLGVQLYTKLKVLRVPVAMFSDNNPNKWGMEVVTGIFCVDPNEIINKHNMQIIVAIKNEADLVMHQLHDRGIKNIATIKDVEHLLQEEIKLLVDEIGVDLVKHMAFTGEGTDKCLEAECFPMRVHFYQPVPNITDLERRNVWSKISRLDGIKWETQKYMENLKAVAKHKPNPDWDRGETGVPLIFNLNNSSFSYICASFLYGMIQINQPKRIIEVGSGNSSLVIRRALNDLNKTEPVSYTIIDPYCGFDESQFSTDSFKINILKMPVEETNLSLFEQLEDGDILFIDSSHVVRIGGDVNFEILEVLPILAPGVAVHFHDITMPYEYPKVYATNPQFRMFWTESYMLQAFLTFNNAYEILLPAAFLCSVNREVVKECYPEATGFNDLSSGGFWLKRI
jgi:hypothetical protein